VKFSGLAHNESKTVPQTPFVPAKAGIQGRKYSRFDLFAWVPAFAGTNG